MNKPQTKQRFSTEEGDANLREMLDAGLESGPATPMTSQDWDELDRIAAGASAKPPQRPVLFLDLDDVLVLNSPYGGYDVALALATSERDGGQVPPSELWKKLVAPEAGRLLRQIHDEFHPLYVMSTSWWWLMNDQALKEALICSGLDFVVTSLHADMSTPKRRRPDLRWNEIKNWLQFHPAYADRWVVLDDELSGTGLQVDEADESWPYIVLCKGGVGLTNVEYLRLRDAFLQRTRAPTV